MKKIAFLNLYSGINNRGAEVFLHGLAQRLAENHNVVLFAGGEVRISGVKVVVVPTKAPPQRQGFGFGRAVDFRKRFFIDEESLAVLKFTSRALTALWKESYDVIVPVNGFWQVILCQLVRLFRRGKLIITGHSGPGWGERWNLYLKPDCFVATTEPTANWAKKTCFWTRVETIPYGVDLVRFREARRLKIRLESPIVLCVAAADHYKRVDLAIEAVAKMERGSLLHLGTGPLILDLKKLGEDLLGRNRFQTLTVPPDKIPGYYVTCDVVTLSSTAQENSPMVFLEAMAAGKYVVATDAPRPRWLLGQAGIFVDPKDPGEYAKAIGEALQKKDRRVIYEQAAKFSWDKVISAYENLISRLG